MSAIKGHRSWVEQPRAITLRYLITKLRFMISKEFCNKIEFYDLININNQRQNYIANKAYE